MGCKMTNNNDTKETNSTNSNTNITRLLNALEENSNQYDNVFDHVDTIAKQELNWPEETIRAILPNVVQSAIRLWEKEITKEMLEKDKEYIANEKSISKRMEHMTFTRIQLHHANPKRSKLTSAMIKFIIRPTNTTLRAKTFFHSAADMWGAINDQSSSFTYYSKRITLGIIYGATLAYSTKDTSDNMVKTKEFLARRIQNALWIEKFKSKIKGLFSRAKS